MFLNLDIVVFYTIVKANMLIWNIRSDTIRPCFFNLEKSF